MSVKFEKETVRESPIPGGRRTDIAHEVGERLTGGKSQTGYLAVRFSGILLVILAVLKTSPTGLSSTAAVKPAPHQNAHIGLARGFARSSSVVSRKRPY